MKGKTVTLWVVVRGRIPDDVILGAAAHYRKTAINRFLETTILTWRECHGNGWRVCKIEVPWEVLKP